MAVGAANTLVKIALAHPVLPSCIESALPRGIDPEAPSETSRQIGGRKRNVTHLTTGKLKY
jgi:hypothetical protein